MKAKEVNESIGDVLKPRSQDEINSAIEDIKKTKKGKGLFDMKDTLDNIGINSVFVGNLLKLPDLEFELEYHDFVDLWTVYNKNNIPLYDGRKRSLLKYLRKKQRRINEALSDVFPPMSQQNIIDAYKSKPEYKRFLDFLKRSDLLDDYTNLSLSNEYYRGSREVQYTYPSEILDIRSQQTNGKEHWFSVHLKENNPNIYYTEYYNKPIFKERIMASPKRLKELVFVWQDVDEQLQELKEMGEFDKEGIGSVIDYIRQNYIITSAPYYRDAIDKYILTHDLVGNNSKKVLKESIEDVFKAPDSEEANKMRKLLDKLEEWGALVVWNQFTEIMYINFPDNITTMQYRFDRSFQLEYLGSDDSYHKDFSKGIDNILKYFEMIVDNSYSRRSYYNRPIGY